MRVIRCVVVVVVVVMQGSYNTSTHTYKYCKNRNHDPEAFIQLILIGGILKYYSLSRAQGCQVYTCLI